MCISIYKYIYICNNIYMYVYVSICIYNIYAYINVYSYKSTNKFV